MSSFKKLNTKVYQRSGPVITPDFLYWKKLEAPVLVKEYGLIDYISFSPEEPHYFAVTCSVRVQVYNPITKLVVKNLSTFRENAYGAVFRSDGRLLCAGDEEANVKLFDVSTKSLLRLFKGHSAAVHRTFFVGGRSQIASFSDDKTVKLWDIATEKEITSYSAHTDYIRAGATSPATPDLVLSGGYDNTVTLYDTRMNQEIFKVNHGSPVESLLFLPAGGMFLSAGGTEIKIWDSLAGGRLLGVVSQHHGTITCLQLASDNKRLISGGLDRHVKIYDLSTFEVVHTLDYPNSILSLGVSKNDDTVVVGMTDGLVSIRRKKDEEKLDKTDKKKPSFRYTATTHQPVINVIVSEPKQDKEADHDRHLRKFEYSKALDCVLLPYVVRKTPHVTVGVMQELIRRRALEKAFEGRDSKSVTQILRFFIKYIPDTRFTRVLADAAKVFLATYENSSVLMSPDVRSAFLSFSKLLQETIELRDQLRAFTGALEMLLSAASVGQVTSEQSKHHNLTPSIRAQENLTINLD